jgi:hypothetical protein
MQWIRSHLVIVLSAVLVVVGLLAYLAFGVFGVQFLFIDDKVDEAAPVFESGAGAATETTATEAPAGAPATTDAPGVSTTVVDGTTPGTVAPTTTVPPPPVDAQPEIITVSTGTFVSRAHPGEGVATVLTDGSSQRFLRFEQFSTDNGPDLNVYLTVADADASDGEFDDEFVDLGNLKGNIGDQNYEIPPEVDLDRFDTVVVWCVRFSVAFTAADLVPI